MGDKFVIGDRVFAKMKGYPYWPGKVIIKSYPSISLV
jgi:hypothetical protein